MAGDGLEDELKKVATGVATKVGVSVVTGAGIWLWGQGQSAVAKVSAIRKSLSAKKLPDARLTSRLLIIGPPGVGKTTTGRLLAGDFDAALDIPGAYQESLGVEGYALRDAPHVQLTVPPGQPHRRYYWDAIDAEVASGKYDGIILLSSYGYHSIGEYDPLPHKNSSDPKYLTEYLAACRGQEILVLDHLLPFMNAAKVKSWLLHFVTKQDLWWKDNQKVVAHYREGEYGKKARLIRPGDPQFKQEFAFGSIVIGNFTTSTGKELAKTTAGYDQQTQVQSLRRFWEIVGALQESSDG